MEQIICPECTLLNNSTNTNCDCCDSILNPDASSTEVDPLENEFMQITGSTRSEAQEYLKTTNNNMEIAIGYYFSDKELGVSNSEYVSRQNIVNSFLEVLNSSLQRQVEKPTNIKDLTCQLLYSRGSNKPHYCEICDSNAYLIITKINSLKEDTSEIIKLISPEDLKELNITEDKYEEVIEEVKTHIKDSFLPKILENFIEYIKSAYYHREKLLTQSSVLFGKYNLEQVEEIMNQRNGPNFRIIWDTIHQIKPKIDEDKISTTLHSLISSEEFHSFLNQSWENPVYNHPASQKVISNLKTIKLTKGCAEFKELQGEKCAICMHDFVEDEREVIMLKCHSFCKDCILPWLENHNDTCPICRKTVGKELERVNCKKESQEV